MKPPFRPPRTNRDTGEQMPGERVIVHAPNGDVLGQVMGCKPGRAVGSWQVYVLPDDRRSIWQSPATFVSRAPEEPAYGEGVGTSGADRVVGEEPLPSGENDEGHADRVHHLDPSPTTAHEQAV